MHGRSTSLIVSRPCFSHNHKKGGNWAKEHVKKGKPGTKENQEIARTSCYVFNNQRHLAWVAVV